MTPLSSLAWCLALLAPLQVGCGGDDFAKCPDRDSSETWCEGTRVLYCNTQYEDCSSGYCETTSRVMTQQDCGSSGNECHAGTCVLPTLSCTGSLCVDNAVHDCVAGRVESDATDCGDLGLVCAVDVGEASCTTRLE